MNTTRRTQRFLVALSPVERETLARLQEHEGASGADVLRRLLLQEARRAGVAPEKVVNVVEPHHLEVNYAAT